MQQGEGSASVWGVYSLLILIALGVVTGRIANVSSKEGDTPFLSANDRSRWCTIAALVEDGTYEIDPYLEIRGAKENRRPWGTIDLVRHRGEDGELHYYSSKPPLLPTMIAGVYWVVSRATGTWLSNEPMYLGRLILWLVNVPTLAIFYLCTISAIDRVVLDRWARCVLAGATCFGTMLMPFAISLNNHLPAATAGAVVLWIFIRSLATRTGQGWWLLAGLAGGLLAANELPALSMTVGWAGILLLTQSRALIGYIAGVAIVAAGFFGTNWIAHQSLRPPYAHRGDGDLIARIESPTNEALQEALVSARLASDQSRVVIEGSREKSRKRIVIDDHQLVGLVDSPEGGFELRHWDDWYDYPGSYWVDGRRRGVDLGEPSRGKYAMHMTVGHHGIFSLTPFWLLVPFGFLCGVLTGPLKQRVMLLCFAGTTIVCGVFYVMRPEIDRNYGGVSICFRWMLWFAPIWLFACARPIEWLCRWAWGRWLAAVLLAMSVASMAISLTSPWQSPWLYRFAQFLGWIEA